MTHDPHVRGLRDRITELDRGILEALNARLRLAGELKRYKESRGLELVDAEREEWLLHHLAEHNPGPLSREGLEQLYRAIPELVKRELVRGAGATGEAAPGRRRR